MRSSSKARSTHQISDDLKDVGITAWNIHVVSKDPAGLKKERIHSANWLETHDLLRDGFIGANFGFIFGVFAAGAMMLFKPFGPNVPGVAYVFLIGVLTLFGAWVGGLTGIAPVAPDRLPGQLPPTLEFPLVITVQTAGAEDGAPQPTNFDTPAPVVFPNLPNPRTGFIAPPGAKRALQRSGESRIAATLRGSLSRRSRW